MIRVAFVLTLLGVCLASHDYGYHKPKTMQCFQCEYRPPKTTTYKVPRQEEYQVQVPKTTYECTEEKVLAGKHYVQDEKKHGYGGSHNNGYGGSHGYAYGDHPDSGYGDSHDDGYGDSHDNGYGDSHGHGYGQKQTYGHYEPTYKTVKRCHPKTEYETQTKYRTVYDTKTKTGPAGGFDPCMGPITADSAKADGVDVWDCHDNCYTRVDGHGNVSRGCFKGEYGVDPNSDGPQTINGMTYNFCKGDYCNGGHA